MAYGSDPVQGDASASGSAAPAYTPTVDVGGPDYSPSIPQGQQGSETRLSRDYLIRRLKDQGYSDAGAQGIVNRLVIESGLNPTIVGDKGTSFGLAQWHNSRRDDLIKFAKDRGESADDPDVQLAFLDHEMTTQYPKLRKQLMAATDPAQAQDAFTRVFERPASVMMADGGPTVTGNDRYRVADSAVHDHLGNPDTSVVHMTPADYLALSPPIDESGNESKMASLAKSLDAGEPIAAIPTLDVNPDGTSGTVTGQDGRNRALMAQQRGVDAIPVALKGAPTVPTELQGMTGNVVPIDRTSQVLSPSAAPQGDGAPPAAQAAALRRPPGSLLDWIIPPAEAAWGTDTLRASQAAQASAVPPSGGGWGKDALQGGEPSAAAPAPAGGGVPAAPSVAAGAAAPPVSGWERAGRILGAPLVGLEQIAGRVLPIPSYQNGHWVSRAAADDAMAARNEAAIQAGRGGDTGIDWERMGLGTINPVNWLPVAGLRAAGIAGKALPMASGALTSMMQPSSGGQNFWLQKAGQGAIGAAAGGAAHVAAEAAGRLAEGVASVIKPLVRWITGTKGQAALQSPGVREVLRRIAQDEKGGGATAQDMLDLVNRAGDKPITLADVGGQNVLALAGRVARAPGESRNMMTNFLNQRDLEAGSRLAGDVNRNVSSGSANNAAAALAASRSASAAPLYEKAFSVPVTMAQVRPLQKFITDPIGQDALSKGMRVVELEHLAEGKLFNPEKYGVTRSEQTGKWIIDPDVLKGHKAPSMRFLDAVKRGYDEIVEGFRDPTSGRLNLDQYGRAVNAVRASYVGRLRTAFPSYGNALDAWSGPSQSLSALRAGQSFLRRSPQEIAERMASLTPGDREFYKLGAADTLRMALAKKGPNADEAKAIIRSQYMRDQLRPLFENDDAYERFIDAVDAESRMFGTRHAVLGNSQTAARQAEDTSPAVEAMLHAGHVAVHTAKHNFLGAAMSAIRGAAALVKGRGEAALNADIARVLTSPLAREADAGMNLLRNFGTLMPATRNYMLQGARRAVPGAIPGVGASVGGIVGPGLPPPSVAPSP